MTRHDTESKNFNNDLSFSYIRGPQTEGQGTPMWVAVRSVQMYICSKSKHHICIIMKYGCFKPSSVFSSHFLRRLVTVQCETHNNMSRSACQTLEEHLFTIVLTIILIC